MFLSRDRDGAARGIFVFDIIEYLKQRSKYNNLFYTSKAIDIIKYTEIRELKTHKKKLEGGRDISDFDYQDQQASYQSGFLFCRSSPPLRKLRKGHYFIDTDRDGKKDTFVGTICEKELTGPWVEKGFFPFMILR